MRVLFDTNVFVAAMLEKHPARPMAEPWLRAARDGTHTGFVAAHSLVEMYSILTSLPFDLRISPALALDAIRLNALKHCEVVPLTAADYVELIEHAAYMGITNGKVYDALLLHAAAKANVDRVVTFNVRHFRQVYPALAPRVVSPNDEGPG